MQYYIIILHHEQLASNAQQTHDWILMIMYVATNQSANISFHL